MSKFTERLNEWLEQKRKDTGHQKGDHKRIFLTLKDDIANALDNGFSCKDIHSHLTATDLIQCTYQTFCKYVNDHIKHQDKATKATRQNKSDASSDNKALATGKPKNFSFNPNPNSDDLF
ncbi:TraK family protein [Motilimonas sp. E26]|uniref:TraK family protein n=1 Tax=Motilimonas sp. E26 TaxID=2865674 RepID=UPI001E43D9BC|nr:TraK family protein [Motilimonas sp. E26]MCE0556707.1 TraK family protein [Motilimonas sp. E26]